MVNGNSIAQKLPEPIQQIYDEAMRCYINLEYDKVDSEFLYGFRRNYC